VAGAFQDCSAAEESGPEGGWNPYAATKGLLLSADRLSAHFPSGRRGLILAEAGFASGVHLILFRVRQIGRLCYVGLAEQPQALGDMERLAAAGGESLPSIGFAIGGVGDEGPTASSSLREGPTASSSPGAGSAEAPSVRAWSKGVMGGFVTAFGEADEDPPAFSRGTAFGEADEVALVLNMDDRTAAYYLNGSLVEDKVFTSLPPGPLFPAASTSNKPSGATCCTARFGLPFAFLGRGNRTLVHAPTPAFPDAGEADHFVEATVRDLTATPLSISLENSFMADAQANKRMPSRSMGNMSAIPPENMLLAVPKKGRLNEKVMKLLVDGVGMEYRRPDRVDVAHCTNMPVTLVFLPAHDIATYVGEGNVDMGITGEDVIRETEPSTGIVETASNPPPPFGFGEKHPPWSYKGG
ncbi:hypothetical protein T484DRAFT_1795131, partial [Baffinella frigidus]